MKVEKRYIDESYINKNPSWHSEDAIWKASQVSSILKDHQINPASICEVGCGSGDILRHLHQLYPNTHLVGYDISPQAAEFWKSDAINNTKHIGGGNNLVCTG
ncbi:class I SAM-dependent methyltransferase [Cylindrospermopsis raciborskii]|uniref:class I SAM-dependent methyltransferase n=2 Tax=Cylindrospermopsis raciborskii TaxID=77022 RepID=UPI001CA4BCE8|nr:class I SAM-dependent methyltransferase [Cylindrospermopsis raciborskii]